ncbi:MAG: hypothetical protein A3B96_04305 [Candidatus Spechtbacteria bacterium RIFCSPHIGHO2_02_FULL_43_15b]|nr:MAG: hypothetical protein A3B96_04305 [Candidatus Spechtbacteria bacterium RIFCSPHIGHO2_02_FULL_43_15b]
MPFENLGVNPRIIRPMTDEEELERDWVVELNGQIIKKVNHLRLFHPRIQYEYQFGMRNEGYCGVISHAYGGGGSIILPWIIIERQLFVCVVRQYRPTIREENVLNAPMGRLDFGEEHLETAIRELREETGFTVSPDRIKLLPGNNINPQASSHDTSRNNEGLHFFSIEILPDEVWPIMPGFYAFKPQLLSVPEDSDEKIDACYFIPWRDAAKLEEMTTRGIVGTLLSVLDLSKIS